MTPPNSELATIEHEILAQIANAHDEATLEAVRVYALGKTGQISNLLKTLGSMEPEARKTFGAQVNVLKDKVTAALAERKNHMATAHLYARLKTETIDVTLPPREPMPETGRVHPVSQVMDEVIAIFGDLGFSVAEGPDIETDQFNFTDLNFPEGHPAREMHDTFFFPASRSDAHEQGEARSEGGRGGASPHNNNERIVLRTHTSPVQIRTMKSVPLPIRVIMPGRTYRCDSDQTHTPMFHQCEGLVVDKGSHMGHLKWILAEFCRAFFEVEKVEMRLRPSFFPFTEPSVEVDIRCDRSGKDIKIGEGDDWLEILGCGMVHPNVLRNCGIDPDEYQGFAWGMGLDRLAMLKYGAPDLRQFFENDQRWIRHYGFKPFDIPTLFGGLSQ